MMQLAEPAYAMELLIEMGVMDQEGNLLNRERLYLRPKQVEALAALLVRPVVDDLTRSDVQPPAVVVGAGPTGAILATYTAACLSRECGWGVEAMFAQPERVSMPDPDLMDRDVSYRTKRWSLGKTFAPIVRGKSALVVVDTLKTGEEVRELTHAVERAGGHVNCVLAVSNPQRITAQMISVRHLNALIDPTSRPQLLQL